MSAAVKQNRRVNCDDSCPVATLVTDANKTGAFRALNELPDILPGIKASLAENGPASIPAAIARIDITLQQSIEISKDLKKILLGDGVNDGVAQKTKEHSEYLSKVKGFFWVLGGALGLTATAIAIIKFFSSR